VEFDSPAHCRWWLTGAAGTVAVQIKMAPLRQPLVQQLAVAVPPASGSALAAALNHLVDTINAADPRWPASLPISDGFDTDCAARELRVASAWAGTCVLDCYLAGNGDTNTTVRLQGRTGRVVLVLAVSESGQLHRLQVKLLS
jgi:type II secretory pathway pseudopilin PulG